MGEMTPYTTPLSWKRKIGIRWIKVFVEVRCDFCYHPSCPHAGESPYPKERDEGTAYKRFLKLIAVTGVDTDDN